MKSRIWTWADYDLPDTITTPNNCDTCSHRIADGKCDILGKITEAARQLCANCGYADHRVRHAHKKAPRYPPCP